MIEGPELYILFVLTNNILELFYVSKIIIRRFNIEEVIIILLINSATEESSFSVSILIIITNLQKLTVEVSMEFGKWLAILLFYFSEIIEGIVLNMVGTKDLLNLFK